ncbi:hypothetical protein CH63R_08515 [Colletotrichum higginsianum IMI 349063]|uniref:Uncharacterized protein n=2 Tax=Colletotrichum higginsianum TaxID=80884 RepID=A0A1B7Y4T3_COLHI|nr:hypothetical protein CH63R_08515 [Colletotrichum higginsianum IMI 349063]OBR06994.1 hypothetical protein CH63R_08515 [Colletotrichum higginsianum IMI 349063]TIC92388.1 hypothetical protein CH35J_010011 [Colletotrichum higginsianum]GJC98877.1 hypothetical protein ColKHC_07703 [Colletotrichum higginsianum]
MRLSSTLSVLALAASALAAVCEEVTPYGDAITKFDFARCETWKWQSAETGTKVDIQEDCRLSQRWPNARPVSYVCIEPKEPKQEKKCFKTPNSVSEPCTIPPSHCAIGNVFGWP